MTARETELTQQLAAALREKQLLREKINLLVRRVFGVWVFGRKKALRMLRTFPKFWTSVFLGNLALRKSDAAM